MAKPKKVRRAPAPLTPAEREARREQRMVKRAERRKWNARRWRYMAFKRDRVFYPTGNTVQDRWGRPMAEGEWKATGRLRVVGYAHPTLFKTLKGASNAAGETGFVAVMNPYLLPIATAETIMRVGGADDEDEHAFAIRMSEMWGEYAEQIKTGSTPNNRTFVFPDDSDPFSPEYPERIVELPPSNVPTATVAGAWANDYSDD